MYINPLGSCSNSILTFLFKCGNTNIGHSVNLFSGRYNLDISQNRYQLIAIALPAFGFTTNTYDTLDISIIGTGNSINIYIDNVRITLTSIFYQYLMELQH
jgi:hypothetical protein